MLTWAHPALPMALKAGGAAVAAWLVVQPIGGFVHQYPYYAPFGAVVAMSTTVAASLRYTVQSIIAILLGAGLALIARFAPVGEVGGIAVVAGVGSLVAQWRRLGAMGGWVPLAGLFVLILGGSQPMHYIAAYGGLTGVGAVIGVGVNALMPQLPLQPATRAQATLRRSVARQLDQLADGLAADERLSSESWERVCEALDPQTQRVDELLRVGMDGQRANWRARRWANVVDRRFQQGRALRFLVSCVEEVVALTTDPDSAFQDTGPHGAELRKAAAKALRCTAAMVGNSNEDDGDAGHAEEEKAQKAVRDLREVATRNPIGADDDRGLGVAAMIVNLERAINTWE